MRRGFAIVALSTLALAACSNPKNEDYAGNDGGSNKYAFPEPQQAQRPTDIDIRERPAANMAAAPIPVIISREEMSAPGIGVTAAPGVAFNYRYAFVLPDTSIAAVQEQHATACEKLGPQRCRITGMRYTLVEEDEVRGQLIFRLDPALARNFGKEGIAAVEKAKGRLVDAAIEGNDVGAAITESQRRSAQIADELARIDKQLAGGGLSEAERANLRSQAQRLRQQQASEQAGRDQGEEMLANTPMVFNYVGKKGFALGDDPLGDAWSSGSSSFTTMVSLILITLGTLLPWALLIGLIGWILRRTVLRNLRLRRWNETEAESPPEPSPASPPPAP